MRLRIIIRIILSFAVAVATTTVAADIDTDGDGVMDASDNCTLDANPTQLDADVDGYGNKCDPDLNNSGLVTAADFNLLRTCLNQLSTSSPLCAAADINGSGRVTSTDFNLLRVRLNAAPGPSGPWDAETIDLQASPFTVATGAESQLLAIVRDPAGNLVKNKTVLFILTDNTGGSLSVGSDVTDSQGRAQSVYTGGSVPSASNGVSIRAEVQGDLNTASNPVEDTVHLTVAQRVVDINIGTGDVLFAPTTSLYSKEWAIIVTDTVGNPVANSAVQVSIRSVRYRKGQMEIVNDNAWSPVVPPYGALTPTAGYAAVCDDEDLDLDGFLSAAEDDPIGGTGFGNGNGNLDAGNRATVIGIAANAASNACAQISVIGGSTVANITTNSGGFARVCVVYPQSDNLWVDVELKAQLSVFGSEFVEGQQFTLEALADDLTDQTSSPAGRVSPFGQSSSCRNPN